MTTARSRAASRSTWMRIAATVILLVYLFGVYFLPDPKPEFNEETEVDRDRPGQTVDPTKTDVFTIGQKHLWIPKRYAAKSVGYGHVAVDAYGPELTSQAERSVNELNKISIRFTSHMRDDAIRRSAERVLADLQSEGSENSPRWIPEAELFEFFDGARRYYYSKSFAAPAAKTFIVACDPVSPGVRAHFTCRVGYQIYGLVYLEYSFFSSASLNMAGWRELDLAVRKFALSVLWYDGELASLPANVGYDDEGRLMRRIGRHTLYFPAAVAGISYASPSIARFMNLRACLPGDDDVCARIILQADENQPMPTNDGDEVFARQIRNYQVGPDVLEGTIVEEYRYKASSSGRFYRIPELDPNGRYPTADCFFNCRVWFVAAPGLRGLYDFDTEHVGKWPELNAAVRDHLTELMNPPSP